MRVPSLFWLRRRPWATDKPDATGGIPEHIGYRGPRVEFPVAPPVLIPHDNQIGASFDRLIDNRRAGGAGLEHLRVDLDVPLAREFLGVGQDGFPLLHG